MLSSEISRPADSEWRRKTFEVIFGTSTRAGRAFDVALLFAILLSVLVVVLESVESILAHWGSHLFAAEIFFTLLFTAEYGVRLAVVSRPFRYGVSFYGLVDLLAISLPT